MTFTPVNHKIIQELKKIAGSQNVFTDQESIHKYSHDETEDLKFFPDVILKPKTVTDISAIMKYCNEHCIAVTPRGGGTGLSGGALPVRGGVVLSLEKLDQIIEIDERNLQVTVEPGVITENLMNAVAEKGFLYPVDPSSKGSCFIGGNMAHGSGGPRVVKYGTIREYVLNLEVVLPNGEIIWTGSNTLKYASGYNLTQLLIGSEGTLAIITKIVLKLIPQPKHDILLLASFPSNEDACAAVSAIFRAGVTPSAVEFMERKGIEWVKEHDDINFNMSPTAAAFLLIELDGSSMDLLFADAEVINEVVEQHHCQEVLFADSANQKEELWRMRRTMAVSIKSNSVYKEEDTVVPRAELPKLIHGIKEIGEIYGFDSVCYGHAGDGNLHVNILKGNMSDYDWNHKLKEGIKEIFELTVKLGGNISGEHGIGLVQKEYMSIKYSEIQLNLMRGIKAVFDPNGILNPDKIF
ncbi:MAG: FAD-binding protein [Bacteroidetes bacterium]|nr:FAD-binding protein [Bacteroidota bacterium]MBU1485822.1 FAD-binding protein [Bacteroidota bacterium]MBU2268163.1 FAD-binding protein [Bacteroidota bacterium]MBU2376557.1 FAD-binding protein [Bacteroidota bacterium]